jgi:hypothetical protein
MRTASALTIVLILMGGCSSILGDDPNPAVVPPPEPQGIDWSSLLVQSLGFLGIEHGFRWVAQEGTRHPHRSFIDGYVDSLNSLHGWADGDPFYVGYVGHPMQGAVAGYLFVQNDRKYRAVEFGKNRQYWKSRLRATAFSWAYSEQFEIGPLSEASIGNTQAFFPQQGFVDQVVTPTIGMAWMIAEDSMDRYVIKRMENRIHKPYVRLLLRSGLNPTRSMANALAGRVPWHRDTRAGIWNLRQRASVRLPTETPPTLAAAPFEFLATTRVEEYFGTASRGACTGGGGAAAFRIATNWQIVGDVSGCRLTNFGANLSGDSLTYLIGPRWTADPLNRWVPYAQFLVGGRTLTHEEFDPVKKAQLAASAARDGRQLSFPDHQLYTRQASITGTAVSASAGLDLKLTPAIAIRVADFGYRHSWHSNLDGINYSNALHVTSGLILRFGTW